MCIRVVRFDDETEEALASLAFIRKTTPVLSVSDIIKKGILAVHAECVQAATKTPFEV